MRVLLAANSLAASGGVATHVRDIAWQLIRRGHLPVVYTPQVGDFSQEMRRQTIPVIDDLQRAPEQPDIIHGHYGLSLMAAMLRFPAAPAVVTCHGWHWPGDTPPNLPNVRRRIAVDQLCVERMMSSYGYRGDEIELVLNGVDLDRFAPRAASPGTPLRAAVFGNYFSESTAEPILAACNQAGVEVDLIGRLVGDDCAAPEQRLPEYDLVFAKGRCVWESLASGCAVIVADPAGLGPLITSRGFEAQRRFNFGRRLMVDPLTPEGVAARIAQYDADDAARVCERVRSEDSLDLMMDQLLAIYDDAIRDPAPSVSIDHAACFSEYAAHLARELAPDVIRPVPAMPAPAPPPVPEAAEPAPEEPPRPRDSGGRVGRLARKAVRELKRPLTQLRGRAA